MLPFNPKGRPLISAWGGLYCDYVRDYRQSHRNAESAYRNIPTRHHSIFVLLAAIDFMSSIREPLREHDAEAAYAAFFDGIGLSELMSWKMIARHGFRCHRSVISATRFVLDVSRILDHYSLNLLIHETHKIIPPELERVLRHIITGRTRACGLLKADPRSILSAEAYLARDEAHSRKTILRYSVRVLRE